jgi:hypothetical protein
MRRVQPAAKKSAPRYPTLRVAWKILAATMPLLPSVAQADATVPGEKRPCPKPEPGERPLAPPGGTMPAPKPPEPPPPPAGKKAGPQLRAEDLLVHPDVSK